MIEIRGKKLEHFLESYGLTIETAREDILSTLKKEKSITVHSGNNFHKDETLGIALLFIVAERILNINTNEIQIIRTRNPEEFKGVILDVGYTYCDHHMAECDCAYRNDGIKYASAGLLWAYLGSLLVSEKHIKRVDDKIFKPSDLKDNGIGKYTYSFAEIMSPIDTDDNLNDLFLETIYHYKKCLERIIKKYNYIEKLGDISPYIDDAETTGILILPRYIPWEEDAVETNIKFVIWKNEDETSDDKYMAKVVPKEIGSFEPKIPFPETFNGFSILAKRSDFFKDIPELSGLNFVHAGRFFASSKDLSSLLNLIRSIKDL